MGGDLAGKLSIVTHCKRTAHVAPRTRYKAAGTNAVNETGAKDTVEFINVSQDDALAWPNFVHRTYPSTVNDSMDSAIKPFMQKSMEVNRLFLDIFEKKLGLPEGELMKRHRVDQVSGSEARCIKNTPKPEGMSEAKTAIGAHTDFGSLVCHGGASSTSIRL
jgi:hypothetical protein